MDEAGRRVAILTTRTEACTVRSRLTQGTADLHVMVKNSRLVKEGKTREGCPSFVLARAGVCSALGGQDLKDTEPSFGDVALATDVSNSTQTHSFSKLRRDCGRGALESVHPGSQELTVKFSRTL